MEKGNGQETIFLIGLKGISDWLEGYKDKLVPELKVFFYLACAIWLRKTEIIFQRKEILSIQVSRQVLLCLWGNSDTSAL